MADKGRIGLIAGSGMLPVLAARKAVFTNHSLAVYAVSPQVDEEIHRLADVYVHGSAGEVNRALRFLAENDCHEVLFMGKVEKGRLFRDLKLDWGAVKLLSKLRERSDDSIMHAIVDLLESEGHKVLSQAEFLPELLAPEGNLNRIKPNNTHKRDLIYGFSIARSMINLGVGQTVVVRQGMILAVEAMEGTNETIRRGCEIGGAGAVVVKVAKPNRDPRFDLPTIGEETMKALCEGKVAALGIEAGSVLIINKSSLVNTADTNRIAVMGMANNAS